MSQGFNISKPWLDPDLPKHERLAAYIRPHDLNNGTMLFSDMGMLREVADMLIEQAERIKQFEKPD